MLALVPKALQKQSQKLIDKAVENDVFEYELEDVSLCIPYDKIDDTVRLLEKVKNLLTVVHKEVRKNRLLRTREYAPMQEVGGGLNKNLLKETSKEGMPGRVALEDLGLSQGDAPVFKKPATAIEEVYKALQAKTMTSKVVSVECGIGPGYTSTILRRLREKGLIQAIPIEGATGSDPKFLYKAVA
ncbi:MAG: hypothetical protein ACWGQW_05215 [bacterium]